VIARYAGDRFALLLPEADADGLVSVLGKLQQGLRKVQLSPSINTSVSATWAAVHYPQDGSDEVELMKRLSEMLMDAKRQTRERAATGS
jgi:GGDEF domain-containing protein